MVHNGIEYGLMQAYAEGYELLARSGLDIDATKALSAWRQGSVVRSWLLDLFVRALEQHPGLEGLAPVAQDSGEGRWTVAGGHRPRRARAGHRAALFARFSSQDQDSRRHEGDRRAARAVRGPRACSPRTRRARGPPPTAPRDQGSA